MKNQRCYLVYDVLGIERLALVNAKHEVHFGQMKRVVLRQRPNVELKQERVNWADETVSNPFLNAFGRIARGMRSFRRLNVCRAYQITPSARMDSATLTKPAILAPRT